MSEIIGTKENFRAEVLESEKPVLVDFWATWCGPCMMLGPIVAELAAEHPEIKVVKVNVDEQPELADAFRIDSIPLLVLIKEGKTVATHMGYRPKPFIEQFLRNNL